MRGTQSLRDIQKQQCSLTAKQRQSEIQLTKDRDNGIQANKDLHRELLQGHKERQTINLRKPECE